MANDYRLDQWTADRSNWSSYIATHDKLADAIIDFRGGRAKGFAYCFVRVFPGLSPELTQGLAGKRIVGRIDGREIVTKRPPSIPPAWIFERDEYAFGFFRIYLESTRGDE
jgi:hypothetical protein